MFVDEENQRLAFPGVKPRIVLVEQEHEHPKRAYVHVRSRERGGYQIMPLKTAVRIKRKMGSKIKILRTIDEGGVGPQPITVRYEVPEHATEEIDFLPLYDGVLSPADREALKVAITARLCNLRQLEANQERRFYREAYAFFVANFDPLDWPLQRCKCRGRKDNKGRELPAGCFECEQRTVAYLESRAFDAAWHLEKWQRGLRIATTDDLWRPKSEGAYTVRDEAEELAERQRARELAREERQLERNESHARRRKARRAEENAGEGLRKRKGRSGRKEVRKVRERALDDAHHIEPEATESEAAV